MRTFNNLDIDQSILENKLLYTIDFHTKLERGVYVTVVLMAILFYWDFFVKVDVTNTYSMCLFFVVVLFLVFGVYRKIWENKLFKIDTLNDSIKNHQLLLDYGSDKGCRELENEHNIIHFFKQNESIITDKKGKHILFLLKGNSVHYVVLNDTGAYNKPILFYHFWVRYELTKLLAK